MGIIRRAARRVLRIFKKKKQSTPAEIRRALYASLPHEELKGELITGFKYNIDGDGNKIDGAVLITDTAGYDDDDAALGAQRIEKTRRELFRTDLAVLVADAAKPLGETERALIALFEQEHTPYLIAMNKCDCLPAVPTDLPANALPVSAKPARACLN